MRHLFVYVILSFCLIQSCGQDKQNNPIKESFVAASISNNSSIEELKSLIEKTENDSIKIEALNQLFFKVVYSDSMAAKEICNTLVQIGKKNKYAKARALNLVGIYHDVKGRSQEALISYQLALAESIGEFPTIAGSAYNNIGLIYWNKGAYLEALEQYHKALVLFEKTGKTTLQSNVWSNMGLIYLDIDKFSKAEESFEKALKIRQQTKDEYGISVSLTNLATSLNKQGKYKEALSLLSSAVQLKQKLKDEIGLSNTLYHKAESYQQLKKFDSAIYCLKMAEQLCLRNGAENNNLTNIYTVLADVYAKTIQTEKLNEVLNKMKLLTDKGNEERNVFNYFSMLSEYYALTGNYQQSLQHYKKADSIYNKLEGIAVKNAINLYETQYQTAKKDKEVAESKLKIAEEKNLSKQKNIWILVLGGFLVIGFLVFINMKTKTKLIQTQLKIENQLLQEKAQLELQMQRLQISRDLHDSLGSQLTLMNATLDNLRPLAESNESIRSKIETLSEHTEQSITELKNAIWVLNKNELSLLDLKVKLLNLIKNIGEVKEDLKIRFTFNAPETKVLNGKQALHIYCIISEILNNSIKHAKATELDINIETSDQILLLYLGDNGIGFDYETAKNKSNGLGNIQKRLSEVQGVYTLASTIQKGTSFTIHIPLQI